MTLNTVSSKPGSPVDNIQRDDNVSIKYEGLITNISSIAKGLAFISAWVSATNLANFSTRSLLDTCDVVHSLFKNQPEVSHRCLLPYERSIFWGQLSIVLLTTSLTLQYLPSLIERIKRLSIFSKSKETTLKDVKIFTNHNPGKVDTTISATHTFAVGLLIVGFMKSMESLIYFSEAGRHSLFGTCVEKFGYDNGLNVIHTRFNCKSALQDGFSYIGTAVVLFATATALILSDKISLLGRVKNRMGQVQK